jgi:hypothetical protein
VFSPDHHTVAAGGDIVANGRSQIERRNSEGCADLDDVARIGGTAKLIAKLGLVAVERVEFVAQKLPAPSGLRGGAKSAGNGLNFNRCTFGMLDVSN